MIRKGMIQKTVLFLLAVVGLSFSLWAQVTPEQVEKARELIADSRAWASEVETNQLCDTDDCRAATANVRSAADQLETILILSDPPDEGLTVAGIQNLQQALEFAATQFPQDPPAGTPEPSGDQGTVGSTIPIPPGTLLCLANCLNLYNNCLRVCNLLPPGRLRQRCQIVCRALLIACTARCIWRWIRRCRGAVPGADDADVCEVETTTDKVSFNYYRSSPEWSPYGFAPLQFTFQPECLAARL